MAVIEDIIGRKVMPKMLSDVTFTSVPKFCLRYDDLFLLAGSVVFSSLRKFLRRMRKKLEKFQTKRNI